MESEYAPTNIHYYKEQLKNVIKNIEKLEKHAQQQQNVNFLSNDVANLMTETTRILTNLERQPTEKIKSIIQKRQRKRQQAKLKRKLKTLQNVSSKVNSNTEKEQTQMLSKTNINTTTSHKPAQKPHQQLRSYRDANRFLKTFELLELLHAARSQNEESTREFANKLSKLRTVWNVISFENKPDFSAVQNLENQWNTVLFGTSEKSFYKQKRSVADLINTRRKWDSYITSDAKIGTTVPANWVLPPENADERWQRYLVE